MDDDFLKRVAQLSEEKRELLEMLLNDEKTRLQTNYVAPRTPVEEVLATIWAQVLGLEQVGIYDNFIELGGESILSIKIAARAIKLGMQLSINQIFDHPTIAELATVVDTTAFHPTEQDSKQEAVSVVSAESSDSEAFTPIDFPEAELSQEELRKIFKKHT
ncbi:MAG: phosphopantetheine-binding protein [Rhizonema sp. PD38]|nr:phosphopantetheine-binding protein [Rhizonema sp. PD38]